MTPYIHKFTCDSDDCIQPRSSKVNAIPQTRDFTANGVRGIVKEPYVGKIGIFLKNGHPVHRSMSFAAKGKQKKIHQIKGKKQTPHTVLQKLSPKPTPGPLTPKRRAKGKFHYPTAGLFSASLKMKIKIFFLLEIVKNDVKKHKMQFFPFRFHLTWTGNHLKIGSA